MTLPQFWRNLFNRLTLLFLIILGGIHPSKAQVLGALESLQGIINSHKENYSALEQKARKNTKTSIPLSEAKSLDLSPTFLQSLLLHSSEGFLSLISQENKCTLYALLQNNLLKTTEGIPTEFLVDIQDIKGETKTVLIPQQNFFDYIYQKDCALNKEAQFLFSRKNLLKTLETISFPVPKSKKSCHQIIEGWKKDPNTPFLCSIAETINAGKKEAQTQAIRRYSSYLNKNLSFFQKNYLQSLCNSFHKKDLFCSTYLSPDIWNKVSNGEEPLFLMSYKCRNSLKKKGKLKPVDIASCSDLYNKEPAHCITKTADGFDSLFPRFSCDQISLALNNSKLDTDYHDCPGRMDNEGIININRVLLHFSPNKALRSTPSSCSSEMASAFASLNLEFENTKAWPLKICYQDRIKTERVCKSYLPGQNPKLKLSETEIISEALQRNHGLSSESRCQFINEKDFNPIRLKYKTGCFLLYNPSNCTAFQCPKKVLLDQKEISGIEYEGSPRFEYFPTSFSNEAFSLSNILQESLKLKTKTLRNLTEVNRFLKSRKGAIIHGVGCAEDLLPERIQRTSLNQCTPLPFILDGVINNEGKKLFVSRISIEDIHSPRLVSWDTIFVAVSSYRQLHPLKSWSLHGLN